MKSKKILAEIFIFLSIAAIAALFMKPIASQIIENQYVGINISRIYTWALSFGFSFIAVAVGWVAASGVALHLSFKKSIAELKTKAGETILACYLLLAGCILLTFIILFL